MEKRIGLIFYIHCIQLEESRSQHFSFISNGTNFIYSLNKFVLKTNAYEYLAFFNSEPYMQLSHMIPGKHIIGGKVSIVSINRTGGLKCVLRPQWGFKRQRFPKYTQKLNVSG